MPVPAPLYPVGLVVSGRACLVVGGGRVAARKAEGLLGCGARVTVVAPWVSEAVRGLGAGAPDLRVDERPYLRGEVAAYRLAVTATDDPEVNRAVFEDGEAAGVWVNSADDPSNCSFTLPAVVRQGPVVAAISTGGRSPALASWLRGRVAELIGPEHATLADLLAEARSVLQASGRSTEAFDWRPLLDDDLVADVRAGRMAEVRSRLSAFVDDGAGS